jgi:hypothetical protein
MKCVNAAPGVVFTTLHLLSNFQMGPKSWSICAWQVFPGECNVTLLLFEPFVSYNETEVL